MAKTATRSRTAGLRASSKPKTVSDIRLRTLGGEKVTVSSIDGNSDTFAEDFLYVFARNVRAARKENKEKLGSPSGVKKEKA